MLCSGFTGVHAHEATITRVSGTDGHVNGPTVATKRATGPNGHGATVADACGTGAKRQKAADTVVSCVYRADCDGAARLGTSVPRINRN